MDVDDAAAIFLFSAQNRIGFWALWLEFANAGSSLTTHNTTLLFLL